MIGTCALRFDATDDPDLLAWSAWEWMRDNWWVCVYRHEREEASPQGWAWCMSPAEPFPVPNPDMHWRRPHYGEALRRAEWLARVQAGLRDGGNGSKYRRLAT